MCGALNPQAGYSEGLPWRIDAMQFLGRIVMSGLLAVALTGTHVSVAQNAPTTVGPVQLTIPEGFEFAKSGRQDTMEVSAWTKGMGSTGTLLQVSIVDMGSQLKTVPSAAELQSGTEKYLQQFLGAVERRRTDYVLSPIRHLTLAGQPA